MTTSNNPPVEFQIPQEPLPVPAMDDIGPVPFISGDGQSFVVIKSAADLDELSDDNDLSHMSILQENKRLLQEELAQLSRSNYPQPSLKSVIDVEENNEPSTSKDPNLNNIDQKSANEVKDSFESTIESLPNSPKVNNTHDIMNRSVLPALPQPQQTYQGLGADENDLRAISIVSFARSDFGSEEIEAKVIQLIEENTHLKDTIIQNNLSMKAQYDRIVAWQNDVNKVHEAHKEKFREAKKCIEALKEENAALKLEHDNMLKHMQIQQTENDKTKIILTETSENNLKEFELDVANKKIKELKEAIKNMNLKIGQDEAETQNWKLMEAKLQRYEKELEQAYKKIREFEKGTDEQERQVNQLKLTQEKLLLAEMTNEKVNKEIEFLTKQLEKYVKTSDDTLNIQQAQDEVVTECDRLIVELESRNSTILSSQSRIQKLEEDLKQANNTLREYQETTQNLREKEEQAKIEAWMLKQKLSDLEQRYQNLQQNTEPARPQYPKDFNPGELAYIRQQLMQSQQALIESEQSRAIADAKVKVLQNEIAELGTKLRNQQTEGDDQFALRAQLDVYKADFEAEREAKEDLRRDKNKISEDLQHLHRRNQQLQEEIEILREQLQQYDSIPAVRRQHSKTQASAPTHSSREEFIYKCPKCDFGFRTLNAVENHIVRCIELNDSLP